MAALQSRDFRLFWVGNVISVSGQQMYTMVQPWIIYELSGSKLLLGLSGLAQAIPATVLTLYGGVIADKVDQKKLLVVASLLQVLTLLTMAAISFTELLTPWLGMASRQSSKAFAPVNAARLLALSASVSDTATTSVTAAYDTDILQLHTGLQDSPRERSHPQACIHRRM